jgi:hypothetical protein
MELVITQTIKKHVLVNRGFSFRSENENYLLIAHIMQMNQ